MLDEGVGEFLKSAVDTVKDVTGIGRDEFGLEKNTEKGWKPKYATDPHKKYTPKPKRTAPPAGGTWNISSS